MKVTVKLIISILCVFLIACVDAFDPKLKGQVGQLVFEGTLTDQPGPYFFSLTYSAGYNSSESIFDKSVNVAKVWITDAKNIRTDLANLSRGRFVTLDGFRGQIGNSYVLHISNEGEEYVSDVETMRAVAPIEKVYSKFKISTGIKPKYRGSFDIFVDTKDPDTEGDYYKWNWKGYRKIKVCDLYTPPGSLVTYLRYCCEDCWDIDQCIGCITMASDKLVNGKTLGNQKIAEIPFDETKPYYLVVEQSSISKKAYNFWLSVEAQVNNSGGIFDVAPATIKGNIKNLNNTQPPILGFFQVSSVQKKIVYIDRNGPGVEPFNIVYITNRVWNTCTNCQESPYRTNIKPIDWIN